MNEPSGVGRGEPGAGGLEQREPLAPRPRLAEAVLQRAAAHVLHREEDAPLVDADVVHGDDVGVGEAGHRLGLSEEARLHVDRLVAAGEEGAQDLDGHLAIELGVVRGVDDPHSALGDSFEEDVAPDPAAGGDGVLRERV
jgi:hypothetical protein